MWTAAKCGWIASAMILTAGSAAWAQDHNVDGRFGPNTVQNELSRYGYTDIHNVKKQLGWSADAIKNGQMVHITLSGDGVVATFQGVTPKQGMQGSSGPYVENSGAGYNRNINYGFLAARNELSQYGYTDISNLHPTQSWSADATKNGQPVHILLNDNGLAAIFSGS